MDNEISIEDLKFDSRNARKRTERSYGTIAKSLEKVGAMRSIVIDDQNVIRAGNGTVEAAIDLGIQKVKVIEADGNTIIAVKRKGISEDDWKWYGVADNRSSDLSEWDPEILKGIAEEVDLSSLFSDLELDALSESFEKSLRPSGEDDQDLLDQNLAEAEKGTIDSRVSLGQVWKLGRHYIACADSTKEENIKALMKIASVDRIDMVWADPPYNCADEMSESFYASTNSPAMKKLSKSEWDKGFDPVSMFSALDGVKPKNGTVYICTSHMLAGQIWEWMAKDSTHNSYCVWVKPNPMPSLAKRHWTWSTEIICYATYGKHVFNFPESGHALNWWDINKNSANKLHPTQKPVEVVERALTRSSQSDAVILDPFLGSAPSIIAAQQMEGSRIVIGFELSPDYCEVICRRFEEFTGINAELVGRLD